ncbi:hypothetical protein IWQ60_011854 [Tieghemiomyces parasiticus]|uniref:Vta1/callose synthase N-terminal domain-containing protein n=1 Tax=Tieghemiomyces parasiticus TaxID=78921 RepID=A0A9W8DGX4_9FUNG|nr:hypothetical protein IWQ60_011854 [Tieghemiomyces parasiticus]
MAAQPPEELRFVNPYLQRARELHTHDPVIAYYCQFYAVKLALGKDARSPAAEEFLIQLVEDLEGRKAALAHEPAFQDDAAGRAHLERFALRIFGGADDEDRAGRATKTTALNFLAASIFIELVRVFGDLPPALEEKLRYAKWKAREITLALKEGRTPTPGTGEEMSPAPAVVVIPPVEPAPTPAATIASAAPSPPAAAAHPAAPSPTNLFPTVPVPPARHRHPARAYDWDDEDFSDLDDADVDDTEVDPEVVQVAEKHARYALSSLQFEDVTSALENLQKAIDVLRPYARS